MKFTWFRKFSPIRNNESNDGQIRSFKGFQKQSKKYKRYNRGFQKISKQCHIPYKR
jgi:hypothetical protein